MLSWLRHAHAAALPRITTSQFCQMYIRPFTSNTLTSFVNVLRSEGLAGESSWFISHTWSNPIADTLEAICSLPLSVPKDSVFVWFDVMAVSQHELAVPSKPKPPSWWMNTFKESIARIGGLVLVVDVWNRPAALMRSWYSEFFFVIFVFVSMKLTLEFSRCVLELHAIAHSYLSGAGRFEVVMTMKEKARFVEDMCFSTKEYYNMLGRVDAESSDCSRPADRQSIHQAICNSVGFEKLNRMVFHVLERWMEQELKRRVEASAAAAQEHSWKQVLGTFLIMQGRCEEATPLFEQCLAYFQSVYDKDDHRICTLDACCFLSSLGLMRFCYM
jgi:hypothetical protein